jgi:hypothetical protein
MIVLGGIHGRYGVEVLRAEDDFKHVVDPQADPAATVSLSYGGQETPTSVRDTVDFKTLLAAVRRFCETGGLDAALHWE